MPKLVDMRLGVRPGTGKDQQGNLLGPNLQTVLEVNDEYIDETGKRHKVTKKDTGFHGEKVTVSISV